MYPSLPIGPISLPTAPFLALIAVWLGLSVMARTGARVGAVPDHLWNMGTVAVIAGFIVSRLWHAVQFWPIYRDDLLLIISPRPGGLAFWPGIIAGALAAYLYLIRKRIEPGRVAPAVAVGLLAGLGVLEISDFLTGATLGRPGEPPWALPYFDLHLYPVALYRGLMLLVGAGGLSLLAGRLGRRTFWAALLLYGLVRLILDPFESASEVTGPIRWSQLWGLILALVSIYRLGVVPTTTNTEAPINSPDSPRSQ